MTTLVELAANIVTANVAGSGLPADELVAEINKVFVALKTLELTGAPEFTNRHSPAEEPMILSFSSPIYSQMDITEMPPFEEELQRQFKKARKGPAPAPASKPEAKVQKATTKHAKPAEVPPKKLAGKEAAPTTVTKMKRAKVKA